MAILSDSECQWYQTQLHLKDFINLYMYIKLNVGPSYSLYWNEC